MKPLSFLLQSDKVEPVRLERVEPTNSIWDSPLIGYIIVFLILALIVGLYYLTWGNHGSYNNWEQTMDIWV